MSEAREIVRTHPITAAVVDLNMPGEPRWSRVIREVDESTDGIPIVVCTADESAHSGPFESMLIEAGAEAVIVKGENTVAAGTRVVAEVRRGLARRQRDVRLERRSARRVEEMVSRVVGLVEHEYSQLGDPRPARAQPDDEPTLSGRRPADVIPAGSGDVTPESHPLVTQHRARMAALGLLLATLLGSCGTGLLKYGPRLPW